MSRTNDQLEEVKDRLDEISHKMDKPDPAMQARINAERYRQIHNSIISVYAAGRSARSKLPKSINYIMDAIGLIGLFGGVYYFFAAGNVIGMIYLLIGSFLIGSTPNTYFSRGHKRKS